MARPDSRIALSGIGGGDGGGDLTGGFLGTLGSLMKIKESQMAFQQKQRDEEDELESRAALQRYDRPEEAIDHLYKAGRSTAASKLAASVYTERKVRADAYSAQLKQADDAFGFAGQALGSVTDDASYQPARRVAAQVLRPILGDGVEDMLPTTYDPARIKALLDAGTSRQLKLQQEQNLAQRTQTAYSLGMQRNPMSLEYIDGVKNPNYDPNAPRWSENALKARDIYRDTLIRGLTTSQNQGEWNDRIAQAKAAGYPADIVEEMGDWSPQAPARLMRRGLSVPQEVNAIGQQAAIEERENRPTRVTGRLTEKQRYDEDDNREKEDAATDKWLHEQWDADHPRAEWPKDDKGRRVKPPFRYEDLDDDTKKEYALRRLRTEDKVRQRVQGLPPLMDAAQQAIKRGDLAGIQKLDGVVRGVTNGLYGLKDLLPQAAPPDVTVPPTSRHATPQPVPQAAPQPTAAPQPPPGPPGAVAMMPSHASARPPSMPLTPQQIAARTEADQIQQRLQTEQDPRIIQLLTQRLVSLGTALMVAGGAQRQTGA